MATEILQGMLLIQRMAARTPRVIPLQIELAVRPPQPATAEAAELAACHARCTPEATAPATLDTVSATLRAAPRTASHSPLPWMGGADATPVSPTWLAAEATSCVAEEAVLLTCSQPADSAP